MPLAKKKTEQEGGRAVIYARYSSNNQKEESIEQQVKECQAFAERKNFTVVGIYSDYAISGKTDNRPEFQKMMRDSKKGGFEFVIAWKSNRIGRNMMQALTNEAALLNAGVKCVYVEEYFDDTASGRFALRNMMNVNQFYIENMAEDIRRGLMDNALKCLVNTRPSFGYKKGEDGRYAVNEETAPIVQEIFQKYLDGWAFIDIANELNRRGLKTVLGNDWNKGSFHSMLRNEMYVGVYKYSDVRIEGGVPALIDKQSFEEVQRRLNHKQTAKGKKNGSAEYLLTGKLFCGHCGEAMVGISGTGRHGDTHYYYRCQGRHHKKNGCSKSNVSRDLVEKRVIESVREFISNDEILEKIIDSYSRFLKKARDESELAVMEAEYAQNKKAIANLIKAIEAGAASETITERISELEAQQRQLEREIEFEKVTLTEITPDQLQFYFKRLQDADLNDKEVQRDLITFFVRAIYLFDDHLKISFNFDKESDRTVTFEQICGDDSSDLLGLYELPTGVLSMTIQTPMTVTVFPCGIVLSVPI